MYKYFTWILLITFVVGCEQQNNEKQTLTETQAVDYLRLPLSNNITTLDPGLIYQDTEIEVVEQLFLGLTDFDPKTYEVVPELATEWQVSQKGTVYTFKLRQDVKWTDGEPVTAHDIVWAIRRNIAKETDSLYAFTLYLLKNAKAIHQSLKEPSQLGVRAIDDYTVEFTLEQAAGYFPALVSFWTYRPLPRKVVEQQGKNWAKLAYIQTNGAYRLTEWQPNNQLILKKNKDYYEAEHVKIPEVHYYIIPDSSLALAMYQKNELDIIGGQVYHQLPQSEMSRIKSDPVLRKEKQISPQFCTEWYGFNLQKPPMDKLLVRKAIAAAIDKKTLIDIVIKREHLPAKTFTRPPVFGAVESNVGISFDPTSAKTWLAQAGYPDGKDFPPLVLIHNQSKFHHKIAKGIKTILKHYLNIDIEIRALDFEAYIDSLKQGSTGHIFRMGWCAGLPDANEWLYKVFHPDKGINWIGWKNREFAKMVDRAQQISNPIGRKKLYHRAEQILTEQEVAIVPLYFSNTQFLVKPWVKGWYHIAFGGQHIRHWSLSQ